MSHIGRVHGGLHFGTGAVSMVPDHPVERSYFDFWELEMIVWSGLGFLVAVITFGFCLLANFVLDAQFGEGYYSAHHWAIGIALILGGLVSSGVGFLLKSRSAKGVSHHSFFFIPMHWAGIVVAVIGLGLAVSEAFQ